MKLKIIIYMISVALIVVSFVLPPHGVIDNSVLFAVGILLAGYEVIFGISTKSIHISRDGIHIEKITNEMTINYG